MRFEDFCLALVFPLHPWEDIRHYGRLGDDGGVDIYAKEHMEDGKERVWFVQCRRYKNATMRTLIQAVDDSLSKAPKPPDVLLIVVACDVRRVGQEAFIKYASERGVATPLLWTASFLEAKLYAERRDLLFAYFGISGVAEARFRESTISRNISLKKRLRREFLRGAKEIDWEKARKDPYHKFVDSEVIVQSVDDTTYPDVDEKRQGISGWFKLEIWDFYHNGLEFIVGATAGIIDPEGRWSVLGYDETYDVKKYQRIKMFVLGRIPYRNIVDFDTIGDEFYSGPHIYCRFADGGSPYEGFRHVLMGDDYPWDMDPKMQFELKRAKKA